MMMGSRLLPTIALGLWLAACQRGGDDAAPAGNAAAENAAADAVATNGAAADQVSDKAVAPEGAVRGQTVASVPKGCPIAGSSGWWAKLGVVPEPLLHVGGTVTENRAGYQISLTEGALEKTNPPTQHVNLVVVEPTGQVAQVVTNYTPFVLIPTRVETFKSVVIDCNGQEIARIDDVHR